jgi:phosphate starvation-inducible PhoH-like protein
MQMKMFLTRMGMTAKFVITGDMSQVDLPRQQKSGLAYALDVLKDVEGLKIVRLNQNDVLRHNLVKKIIDAFDKFETKPMDIGGTSSASSLGQGMPCPNSKTPCPNNIQTSD